ncbi:MAG: hypothetical protein GFH27_549321n117 [Chloroflexi bacterium AL-W]|nr:hypothetical protein [Chloroflexi bacterium AL-N1]NOK64995.1 hypothetical protein [Chloroflexi bacterium AL-N10]NOK76765.1 hypothetical protein [Chloroflexi bacterium AL-N5]NOK84656.1 hypothetical protein [Chloroflexi bacterium AL-W]NOK86519.1 hypothetical protein [Chloroflexi bacterium AL-N15]
MTILLIGGTGLLGGAVAAELVKNGEPVRALVRSGKHIEYLRTLGVEFDVGDLCDPRSLRRALADIRVVVTTAQSDPFDRNTRIDHIDGKGNQNLIAAASEAGVEHFVFVSALKADVGSGDVMLLACKHAAELALKASGLRYSIIRPASFQEIFGNDLVPLKQYVQQFGVGLIPGNGKGFHSFVSIHDVARTVVLALQRSEAINTVIDVGGPDDLTYREAYTRIMQMTGQPRLILPLHSRLLAVGGTLSTPVFPNLRDLLDLFAFCDRVNYTCVSPTWLIDALGRRRSFDDGIREMYSRC